MLLKSVLLAALGATCAGCSAPPASLALTADNPANPDAAQVPFVRPANVLAAGAAPPAMTPAAHRTGGAMAGMAMPGDAP